MDKNKVIESAAKLIAKGAFDKAVKEYQRVLEIDPDDVRVLQKLAELYQKMNRKAEAADCFEKVARTYSQQGFYLKAVALYKQVLKVIERVEVNIRLAELYQQLGLVGDATKEWQAVAAHHEKSGDTKASLDTLKKLVDLDPDNVAARIRLGEQYARQDDLIEAVAELRRAAQYLQRNGRHDDYLRVAERISHLDQNDVGLAKELAEQYLSRGDSKRALAKLHICFKANPRELSTLQMLARAFQDLGQVTKTVSVLKELARVHVDGGRPDDARKVWKQALELAPDDQEVKAGLKSAESGQSARPKVEPPRPAPPKPAPKPAAAPPRPVAKPISKPISAPIPVPPQRTRSAPIHGARPASAPVAAAGAVSAPMTIAQVPKLLKETEVYVKYGLNDKALEHLRRVFSVDRDNIDAHEKAKIVALAMGRKDEALASLTTMLRLCTPEPLQAVDDDEFAVDLAEADFYIQAGLPDDARAILEGITLASPNHTGASQRLRKLGKATQQQAPAADKEFDDMAAELAAELAAEVGTGADEEDQPLDGDVLESFQVPASEVLGEFRAKIQEIVRPEDVQTHYDLGIAYKEMGLLEEAIAEFDVALRHGGGTRAADCLTMLGICESERGNAEAAVAYVQQGLELPELTSAARHALQFELGAVQEGQGNNAEALEQYESIHAEDKTFRDVKARIEQLGGNLAASVRPLVRKRPQATPAGPRKVAAHGTSGATAGSRPAGPGSREPEPSPDPGRKNRKIGFV
ncbi:MAG: tetratricopeptide repeat protein [Deltaproteobacteria bacterium]|nr:MAG: tetratricopeptide repeat protein [Deltaproteobacteria bacterium]